jgi:hypothetical protein
VGAGDGGDFKMIFVRNLREFAYAHRRPDFADLLRYHAVAAWRNRRRPTT